MIPNRFHFIFGLDPTFGGKPFSLVHYLAIASAAVVNKPEEIVLHYAYEPSGEWWDRSKSLVQMNRVQSPDSVHGMPVTHHAHKSDVLRLEILKSEGGIYLDCDTLCVSPFRPLLGHETVMGIEPNAGLCNAVILSERDSPFIRQWFGEYRNFNETNWRSHAVTLPYVLARAHPELIHVEGPNSFFFPTYDDPMHVLLWREEISLWQRVRGFAVLAANIPYYASGSWPVHIVPYLRGTLLPRDQYFEQLRRVYCMHLWESIWWDKYLKDISLEALQESGGMYARLVAGIFEAGLPA